MHYYNPNCFEQTEVWGENILLQNPYYRGKIEIIKSLIPPETRTILDVGCGDGSIIDQLDRKYALTGVDLSQTAIKLAPPDITRAVCSSTLLPFADRCFDLVMCHDLLEHFPEDYILKTTKEIARVAKRYIIISAPEKENLRARYTICDKCRTICHAYGHIQSFTFERLARYFPDFSCQDPIRCGEVSVELRDIILRIAQKLGKYYFFAEHSPTICPKCGHKIKIDRQRIEAGKSNHLRAILALVARKMRLIYTRGPYWIICPFERKQEA